MKMIIGLIATLFLVAILIYMISLDGKRPTNLAPVRILSDNRNIVIYLNAEEVKSLRAGVLTISVKEPPQ